MTDQTPPSMPTTNDSTPDVTPEVTTADAPPRFSRRGLLGAAGAGVLLGAVGGSGITFVTTRQTRETTGPRIEDVIRHNYSPHGPMQAGIITPVPYATRLIALDLTALVPSATELGVLLKALSVDIAALMAGRAVLDDPTPDLAQKGTSLSVTVGLGHKIFDLPGIRQQPPTGFIDIPEMRHDALDPRWSSGDLLLVIAADDLTTVDYAMHTLLRRVGAVARVKWVQEGHWRATDSEGNLAQGRNMFGQRHGVANPVGQALDAVLHAPDAEAWFAGGTTLVVRRIAMDLDGFAELAPDARSKVLGRRINGGAMPGSGADVSPSPSPSPTPLPAAYATSHVVIAHPNHNGGAQIFRRPLNFAETVWKDGRPSLQHGLILMSFQANIDKQFVPIQRSLDKADAMNAYTSAVGSSVWVIPPGFATNSFVAAALCG